MSENKSIYNKLFRIQHELNVPKEQFNGFGKYNYRSCEDILQAVKPLLFDNKLVLTLLDDLVQKGERYYLKATAQLIDIESGEKIDHPAYAREAEQKAGMDPSQITGSCSSYARKYALAGLFLLDDNKDADTMDNRTNSKDKYINSIRAKIKNGNIGSALISSILHNKYNKSNSAYLSLQELQDLDKNFEKYIKEKK